MPLLPSSSQAMRKLREGRYPSPVGGWKRTLRDLEARAARVAMMAMVVPVKGMVAEEVQEKVRAKVAAEA